MVESGRVAQGGWGERLCGENVSGRGTLSFRLGMVGMRCAGGERVGAPVPGWSVALLAVGCVANHIVVVGQWTPESQWQGQAGLCCDIAQAGAEWQQSSESDDHTCDLACQTHQCGRGHAVVNDDNPNVITCTCYHRETPTCNSPCDFQNNGECDELPGVDGMGALCAPGTDVEDCVAPDIPLAPTPYPSSSFGRPVPGNVVEPGERTWFSFSAEEGSTYVIEAHRGEGERGLADTLLSLYDHHSGYLTLLAQNDDAPDGSLDSYIEWTCAADGEYLVSVTGFLDSVGSFTLVVAPAGAELGDVEDDEVDEPISGDPCYGGSTLTQSGGEIAFSPDRNQQVCSWSIICPAPQCLESPCPTPVVRLDFSQFQLSGTSEYVLLLDGPSPFSKERVLGLDGDALPPLTGSLQNLQYETGGTTYTSSGSSLTVHFQGLRGQGSGSGADRVSSGDHFTASYMCTRQDKDHQKSEQSEWLLLLLLSIVLSICLNVVLIRRRRARVTTLNAGRMPLVPAIEAVATPVVDIETSQNPVTSPTLVAASSAASASGTAGLPPPSPLSRTGSSLTGRWVCPACHRENAAYRTRCEGCPGTAVAAVATSVEQDDASAGLGATIVVQSSAVLGVATETLNSLLRACSLEAFESSIQELGVVESDDLRTLSDEQLNSLGMKPVEIERLRRRLQ